MIDRHLSQLKKGIRKKVLDIYVDRHERTEYLDLDIFLRNQNCVSYIMQLTDSNTPNNMKVVKSLAPSSQTTEMRLLTTVSVMACKSLISIYLNIYRISRKHTMTII